MGGETSRPAVTWGTALDAAGAAATALAGRAGVRASLADGAPPDPGARRSAAAMTTPSKRMAIAPAIHTSWRRVSASGSQGVPAASWPVARGMPSNVAIGSKLDNPGGIGRGGRAVFGSTLPAGDDRCPGPTRNSAASAVATGGAGGRGSLSGAPSVLV
jgi:hypothetical protein